MKALTIMQPWATLIALGEKRIETRSWKTNYRGDIAIHAGKNDKFMHLINRTPFFESLGITKNIYPFGAVIAIAKLVDCVLVEDYQKTVSFVDSTGIIQEIKVPPNYPEIEFGFYQPGRYAWILSDVKIIEFFPVNGMQGLWNVEIQTSEPK